MLETLQLMDEIFFSKNRKKMNLILINITPYVDKTKRPHT